MPSLRGLPAETIIPSVLLTGETAWQYSAAMEMLFCRRCGQRAKHVRDHIYECPEHVLFANSQPACAAIVVNSDGNVVVGVRAIEPFMGAYDLPGGFVDHQETFEECITRELNEELGLAPEDLHAPRFVASGLDEYSFRGEVLPVLTVTFAIHVRAGAVPVAADDLASLVEIAPADIDLNRFCFPSARAALTKFLPQLVTA